MHPKVAAILSAGIMANLAILMLNQGLTQTFRAGLAVLVLICIARTTPPSRVFWPVVIICLITAIHASSSYFVSDVIFHTRLLWNREFDQEVVLVESHESLLQNYQDSDQSLAQGLPILFHQTQRAIHASQSRCHSNMTVYMIQGWGWGMGSEMHLYATVLAFAMDQENGLFAWGKDACKGYQAQCRDLYLPEHTCTDEQIQHMKKIKITDWPPSVAPKSLITQLPQSFTQAQAFYWWLAQAIGYLMRLNKHTAHRIRQMREELHGNLSLSGVINVNIRSGDKRIESRLSPTEYILKQAEILIVNQPLAFSRSIFITSDNLEEILKAENIAQQMKMRVLYSNIPRMVHGHNQADVKSFWNINVTIAVLMDLFMASECDAWVGTRSSNWNRLIDILRCVHARKCKQIFVESGDTMHGHYDRPPNYWV